MTEPLRLMIYDTTDISFKMFQLQYVLPEDFLDQFGVDLEAIDLEIPVGLTHSWFAGGRLYRWMRWIDRCEGFSSWESALKWVAEYEGDRPIQQLQVWGHGSPGRSWFSGEPIHKSSVTYGPHSENLQKIASRMTDDGLIWFRNCSVFAGTRGREFGKAWAKNMDCRIAAHTYIIGPFQSGLHCLSPGQEPAWDPMEGIAAGTPDRPTKLKNSLPWSPNTTFMLSSDVPQGW